MAETVKTTANRSDAPIYITLSRLTAGAGIERSKADWKTCNNAGQHRY